MADSAPSSETPAYRVLARKYRPQTFDDLIGQEALVRTLANAFESGRVAQAYMLTGVRGVGKTTTARLIARALNYPTGATINMPEITPQCEAILESRHMDVIEMDAASNTGVDNMREIIDSVRYAPVSLRTKVYIIDEVHMLSKSAFNALLKTLEEPPPHVKFIFATTEIRKVPVTILSRCQRFDLRRMDVPVLTDLYAKVARAEGIEAEDDALRMIARAAEGSARDGLSLLDRAIVHGQGSVKAADVVSMLGLSDRTKIIDLFEAVMAGKPDVALTLVESQHQAGGEPEVILTDLAEFVHWVTRLKVAKTAAQMDASKSGEEKSRGLVLAETLTVPALTRAWQMLLKGISETAQAYDALQAAEMVIIRLCHAASLPAGDELVRLIKQGKDGGVRPPPAGVNILRRETSGPAVEGNLAVAAEAQSSAQTLPAERRTDGPPPISSFSDIVALAKEKRNIKLQSDLETYVRPVRVAMGRIEMALEAGAPPRLLNELKSALDKWTGYPWIVATSKESGAEPIAAKRREAKDQSWRAAPDHPVVKAIFAKFPGAIVVDVKAPDAIETPNDTVSDDEEPV
jgi:DNA polymerase III subunit gamma/tau